MASCVAFNKLKSLRSRTGNHPSFSTDSTEFTYFPVTKLADENWFFVAFLGDNRVED